MKTTITISLIYAQKAYDALTDNRFIEENICNEYPDVWIIDEADDEKHEEIIDAVIAQLEEFKIQEYEIQEASQIIRFKKKTINT